jgi:peptidyl-tRNA hydrolase
MFLVLQKGSVASLADGASLAGAAAVACVRSFASDERFADAFAAWRERPGKVCLRARSPSQWEAVLEEPHAGDTVIALPPRRRSERGPVLEKLQAMSTDIGEAPSDVLVSPGRVTYVLNPAARMSSGKTLAQVAHAAVLAADSGRVEPWVAAGCPALLAAPDEAGFARACGDDRCVAKVVDAGLTEVPPGTITVVALMA